MTELHIPWENIVAQSSQESIDNLKKVRKEFGFPEEGDIYIHPDESRQLIINAREALAKATQTNGTKDVVEKTPPVPSTPAKSSR